MKRSCQRGANDLARVGSGEAVPGHSGSPIPAHCGGAAIAGGAARTATRTAAWHGSARPATYRPDDLIACLDQGGYARYDVRTATWLQAVSEVIGERYDGQAAVIGQRFTTYPELRQAGVTAAELMSTPPVTISPDASVAEAAKLMYERVVKRLPVVDSAGQLAGIVSRIDVLSVFTRPDGQIRDDVMRRVVAGRFALDPAAFEVSVTSGIVTVTGQVERRAVAHQLIDAVRHLEGVVDVRDRVSYPSDGPLKTAGHVRPGSA